MERKWVLDIVEWNKSHPVGSACAYFPVFAFDASFPYWSPHTENIFDPSKFRLEGGLRTRISKQAELVNSIAMCHLEGREDILVPCYNIIFDVSSLLNASWDPSFNHLWQWPAMRIFTFADTDWIVAKDIDQAKEFLMSGYGLAEEDFEDSLKEEKRLDFAIAEEINESGSKQEIVFARALMDDEIKAHNGEPFVLCSTEY